MTPCLRALARMTGSVSSTYLDVSALSMAVLDRQITSHNARVAVSSPSHLGARWGRGRMKNDANYWEMTNDDEQSRTVVPQWFSAESSASGCLP